jgi:hypothetical protein
MRSDAFNIKYSDSDLQATDRPTWSIRQMWSMNPNLQVVMGNQIKSLRPTGGPAAKLFTHSKRGSKFGDIFHSCAMLIYTIITPAAQPLQTFAPAPSPSTTALAKAIFINQLSTAQRYALLTPLHAPQKILQPQPILESTMSRNTQSNRYRQLPSKRYRKKTPRSQIHITGGYCSNEASCVYTASHIRKMCRNCIKESKGCVCRRR